jgi:hypothetical protein
MSQAAQQQQHEQRVIGTLLFGALILAALMLMAEGPHFDNILESWRFFSIMFFSGALAGFVGWTQTFRIEPSFGLSPKERQPWVAALVLGLMFVSAGSFLNRKFATPTGRTVTLEVDSVVQSKQDRWHLMVRLPDGYRQRYLVSQEEAAALKEAPAAQLTVSRGVLSFEFFSKFEPKRQ